MQAKREEADDAYSRQDVDVVCRLHVPAPLFHRQVAINDVGRRVENAPFAAQPIHHGNDV